MPSQRWVLLQASGHLVAVPLGQVAAVWPQSPGVSAPGYPTTVTSLAERLWGQPETEAGATISLRGRGECGVRVGTVVEILEDLPLAPLPALLARAVGAVSFVIGILTWGSRLVPAVDLWQLWDSAPPSREEEAQGLGATT